MRLNYLQIELTGACANACPLCLPEDYKTGVHMSLGESQLILKHLYPITHGDARPWWTKQFRSVHPVRITFAGYGNPVEHPDYNSIVGSFSDMLYETTVTCRVQDLGKIGPVDRANVSIDSFADAQALLEYVNANVHVKLVPHIVLAGLSNLHLEGLYGAIHLLADNAAFFEKISIACAVILCPEHADAVTDANNRAAQYWETLYGYLSRQSEFVRRKVVFWGWQNRMKSCAWRKGGLLINSKLQVLPCCNLPCAKPIGDLHNTDLVTLLKGDPHSAYLAHCVKCPEVVR